MEIDISISALQNFHNEIENDLRIFVAVIEKEINSFPFSGFRNRRNTKAPPSPKIMPPAGKSWVRVN